MVIESGGLRPGAKNDRSRFQSFRVGTFVSSCRCPVVSEVALMGIVYKYVVV